MTRYSLRPATVADFAFMREVKFSGLREYVEQMFGWNQEEQERRFQAFFEPSGSRVILRGDEPVGYVHLIYEEDSVFLAGIYIAAAFQRQGIGTRVIEDILREIHAEGKAVRLQVLKSNPARALYERIGFRVLRETDSHFEMVFAVIAR